MQQKQSHIRLVLMYRMLTYFAHIYSKNNFHSSSINTCKTYLIIVFALMFIVLNNAFAANDDYSTWSYSSKIYFNTSGTGADVAGNVTNVPVLIRLTSSNFAFSQADADGDDIRFADTDGTHLPYEIERWENGSKVADIWVLVPQVDGGVATDYITMLWGKSGAGDSANSTKVFNTDDGFVGVWHLDEEVAGTGNTNTYQDATSNTNHGNDYISATSQTGMIVNGHDFDGSDDYIEDPDGENYINGLSAFTASLWIKSDETNSDKGFLLGKDPDGSDDVFALRYDALGINSGNTPNVIKAGITTTGGAQQLESSGSKQTTSWQHVVLTWSSGNQLTLYIDGSEDTPGDNYAATAGTITGSTKLIIGQGGKDETTSWNGHIDEVRISDEVRDANWVKLSFENQQATQTLTEPVIVRYWDGSSSTDWSTAANWEPEGVPASDDEVVFNSLGAANCVLSEGVTVAKITFESGFVNSFDISSYTLTVTGDANFSSGGSFSESGGTVDFTSTGTQVIIPSSSLTIPFITHSGSGTLQLSTNTLTTSEFLQTNGTLDFNSQNITTVSSGNFTVTNGGPASLSNLNGRTITVAGDATFAGSTCGSDEINLNPGATWIIAVSGNLTASMANIDYSTASVSGGVATESNDNLNNSGWTFSSGKVWLGITDANWSTATNWCPSNPPINGDDVIFNATSNNCTLDGAGTNKIDDITFTSGYTGAFDFSNKTMKITGNADFRSGGSFTSTGLLQLEPPAMTTKTIIAKEGETLPEIYMNQTGTYSVSTNDLTVPRIEFKKGTIEVESGITLAVTGELMIINSTSLSALNGNLDIGGNATLNGGSLIAPGSGNTFTLAGNWVNSGLIFTHSSGTVAFDGGGAQTITSNGNTFYGITINKSAGTAELQDAIDIDGDLTVSDGTLDVKNGSNYAINLAGNVVFTGGTFTPRSGTVTLDASSGTQQITSAGNSLYNLTITNNGSSAQLLDALDVNNLLTLSASGVLDLGGNTSTHTVESISVSTATLDFGNSTMQVNGDVNLSNLSTLTADAGTLEFTDGSAQVFTPKSGGTHPIIKQNGAGGTTVATNALTCSGLTVTSGTFDMSANTTALVSSGAITVNGGTLTATNGTIDLNSDMTISSGVFTAPGSGNSFSITGSFTHSGGTFTHSSGTATFDGTSSGKTINAGATGFYDLIVNGSGGAWTLTADNQLAVANDLTITAGTLDISANTRTLTVTGNTLINGGTLTATNGNIDANGNFTVSSGVLTAPTTAKSFAIFGSFAHSGGTFTHSSGTVTFNGTASGKTINAGATGFNDLVINGTGGVWTVTADNHVAVADDFTCTNGTIDISTNSRTLTVAGTFTVDGGTLTATGGGIDANENVTLSSGTLTAPGGNFNVKGNWNNSGAVFTHSSGTVTFDATTGTQTITSDGDAFYNFTLNNNGATAELQDALDVNGNFTLTAGTFDSKSGSNFSVNVAGNCALNGGTFTPRTNTFTFDGSSGTQQITSTGKSFYNVTVNNNGASAQLQDAFDVDNLLTLAASAAFDIGNNSSTHTVEGISVSTAVMDFGNSILQVNGDVNLANLSTLTADGGTLEFTDGSAQVFTPKSGSTHPIIIQNGAGGTSVATNDLSCTGVTLTSGAFDISTNTRTLTSSGAITISGGTLTATNGNIDANDNFTLSSGVLTAPGAAKSFTVFGNFIHSSGTFTHSSGTVTLDGTASGKTMNAGSTGFYDLIINGSGGVWTLSADNNLAVANDFTCTAGTINISDNARTMTVTGVLTLNGGTLTATGGSIDANGNVTLSSGTLTAPSGNFNVKGNWNNTAATFTHSSGTLIFDATTGTQQITSGGDAFYNFTQNNDGATLELQDALDINGAFTLTAGIFDAKSGGNYAVNIEGNCSLNGGTFTPRTNTFTFDGSGGTQQITSGGKTFYNVTINNSGAIAELQDAFAASNTLTLTNGTLDLANNGHTHSTSTLSIAGGTFDFGTATLQLSSGDANFTSVSTLIPGTGTLQLTAGAGTQVLTPKDATTHPSISHTGAGTLQLSTNTLTTNSFSQTAGGLDFNSQNITTVSSGNFTITNGTNTMLTGLAGRTITVAGDCQLDGQDGNRLNLDPGSAWTVTVSGNLTADYAEIENSDASGSASQGVAQNSLDQGTNDNWFFSNPELFDTDASQSTLTASMRTDGSGNIDVYYQLHDNDHSTATITGYYREGADAYAAMTNISGDAGSVATTDSSVHRNLIWDIATQLGTSIESSQYQIRLFATDALSFKDTIAMASANLAVDTKSPAVSIATHFETAPVAGTEITLDAAFTETNPNTNVYYYQLNADAYDGGTAGTTDAADPDAKAITVAEINGDDYFNAIKSVHTDDFGNATTSEATDNVYVKPYTPQAPTVDNATASTVDVTINAHVSAAAGIDYAIYITPAVSGNNWIQANGSVGASEVWQTAAVWGTKTVTGLSSPVSQYDVQVKSRNSVDDATESDLSSVGALPNSAPFAGYAADDVIPTAQVVQSSNADGLITVTFRAKDPDLDLVYLESFGYSDDGGNNWYTPTNGDASEALAGNWPDNSSSNFSSATDWSGTQHTFTFNTKHADVVSSHTLSSKNISNFQIRFKVNDATVASDLGTSQSTILDNVSPVEAIATHFETAPVAGTKITLDASFTETNPNTNTYYYNVNATGYDGGTAGTSDAADPDAKAITVAEINGDDYYSAIKTTHVDDYGYSVTSEVVSNTYVKPYQPQAPTISSPTASTVAVAINAHASAAASLDYAIYISPAVGGNNWVAADGSVGGSEIWQTVATWGTKTITGLSSPVSQYSIQVKSRNSVDDATESDLSTAGQITNTAPIGGYTADNVIPTAQVTQSTDGNGIMTITFKVKDTESDNVTLNTFEYSVNSGGAWSAPTNADASEALSTDWESNSYTSAASFGAATGFSFTFNTKHADVSGLNGVDQSDVQIRFTVNDATTNSASPATSQDFAVDDVDPVASAATHFETAPVAGTEITLDAAFTEANPNTNVYYYSLNADGYDGGTAGTTNSADPDALPITTAAINGDDFFTAIKTLHTDDYGNTVTSEVTTDVYVKPYQPQAPTISSPTASTVDVAINAHASAAAGLDYAIYISPAVSGNNWIAADGSVGAAEVWQTVATWGTETITGLSSPVSQYSIQVKSRNSVDDATESDLSTAGQITNTAPIGGYSADNVIPTAQVTQSTDGNGIMTITFKVKDTESDNVTLNTFEYSVNSGGAWSAPTNADASEALSTDWESNSYTSAASFGAATGFSFTFNTKHADVSGLNGVDQSDV
ncbi:MAG: DUF2341 domain-containing protein, partial [Fibrobacteria bacterium]|nr:DUF2341 domain-containing protein [Fibrobacteria bacterium]